MAKKALNATELVTALVEKRAYEVFLSRGGTHGSDMADWLEAERQLREEGALLTAPKARRKTAKKHGSIEQPA